MTPITLNLAPLTKRISTLAIAAAAALSFAVFSPNAQANHVSLPKFSKEYIALSAKLPSGVQIENATTEQLVEALTLAINDPSNSRLKPGNIAGEALKHAGSLAQDGGDEIGAVLSGDLIAARDAIKRAGKGKDLNVSLVPDFATAFFDANNPDNSQALALAKLVIASKPGAGAVIGGRASQLTTDALRLALANEALAKAARLTAAAQDITKFVVAEVDGNTADFARDVAITPANVPLAAKIGTGAVAGDPLNGGAIVDRLLNETTLAKLRSGIAGFAKTVANVADIEEMVNIAIAVGNQMAIVSGTSTAIKFAKANSVVASLAKAIVAKSTTADPERNAVVNKQDEIAEVVAYMIAKAINPATVSPTIGKPQITSKNAGAKILAIIKSAVNATKGKKVENATNPSFFLNVATDVVGSVAETLGKMQANSGLALNFEDIKAFLIAKAGSIAGKTHASMLQGVINDTFNNQDDDRFEDGTIASNAENHDVPPTDHRLF